MHAIRLACFLLFAAQLVLHSLMQFAHGAEDEIVKLSRHMGSDLACAACAQSMEILRMRIASTFKKSMKKKEKEKAAASALDYACSEHRWAKQLATVGEAGDRRYHDFQELWKNNRMKEASTMSLEHRDNLLKMCGLIKEEIGERIIQTCVDYKQRIGGFNFERFACVKGAQVCKKTIHLADDEEDEEEEL